MSEADPFSSKKDFPLGGHYHSLDSLDASGLDTSKLPYSIRVLLEGALRNCDGFLITEQDVRNIAEWTANGESAEKFRSALQESFYKTSQEFLLWLT